MSRVTRAIKAKARRGEHVNLEISDFVDAEDGYNRHAATGKGTKGRLDRNRLSDHNHLPKIGAQPAAVYDNMGHELGTCQEGQAVEINAGAVTKVLVGGKPTECIFVYKAVDAEGNPSVLWMGWVPLSSFVQDKVLHHVVAKDEHIAKRLEKAQRDGVHLGDKADTVTPYKLPDEIGNLRTLTTKADRENFARHYGARDDHSVNLLIDVPGSGQGRIGAASDRVGPGSKFFRATNIAPSHTPLFETQTEAENKAGTARHSSHFLTFVYGCTENQVGERQYGWLLQDHLQPG
jgi:hypothetical protein